MTERLSQLMHDEATRIPTPAVPDPARLAVAGRRLRRRRQVTNGLAVAASVAVLAGTGFLLMDRSDSEPQPVDGNGDAIVWGYDTEVHVGDATAEVPGTLLSLHQTSVGVLAVSTTEDASFAGPAQLTLVRYDGTTADLGELEAGQAPVTDSARDVYVLAELRGTDRVVSVRDAATGELRDEFAVPGLGGSRPGMSLDGDTLYVRQALEKSTLFRSLDLTTGEVAPAPRAAIYYGGATDGRAVTGDRRTFRVVDVASGEELMTFPTAETLVAAELSPDGRFLRVVRDAEGASPFDPSQPRELQVYEVATGELVPADIGGADAAEGGWTPSGDLYAFTETGVVRCEVPAGECTETTLDALPDLPEPELGSEPLAQIVRPDQP